MATYGSDSKGWLLTTGERLDGIMAGVFEEECDLDSLNILMKINVRRAIVIFIAKRLFCAPLSLLFSLATFRYSNIVHEWRMLTYYHGLIFENDFQCLIEGYESAIEREINYA